MCMCINNKNDEKSPKMTNKDDITLSIYQVKMKI